MALVMITGHDCAMLKGRNVGENMYKAEFGLWPLERYEAGNARDKVWQVCGDQY